MTFDEQVVREQICDVCHKMWQLGWVAANDGNVSVRIDEDTIIATPTGISKSFITPEKLVKLNMKGEVIEANEGFRPSSEIKMHIRCYEERDDVRAVVHALKVQLLSVQFQLHHSEFLQQWKFQMRLHHTYKNTT